MGFEVSWLTLREPADARSRDSALLEQVRGVVASGSRVLDLGCGTGATLRALMARGITEVEWHLLDNDPALLTEAAARHPGATTHVADLADIDALPLDDVVLVTASALLDLVSRDWLTRLASRLSRAQIPFYAVLSYDGRMQWTPADPDDGAVTQAFNAHQGSDKGLGAALGPEAGDIAARVFRDHGFEVALRQSPWRLGPQDAALHEALLTGIAQAATEAGCDGAQAWLQRRRADLPHLQGIIGHVDLLAVPHGQA
jgi:SAM-dependent methyltransferase